MLSDVRWFMDRIDTPIGELTIVADAEGNLRAVDWMDYEERMRHLLRLHYGTGMLTLEEARDPGGLASALRRYFAGDLKAIEGFPCEQRGRSFSKRYGGRCERFRVARRFRMRSLRGELGDLAR